MLSKRAINVIIKHYICYCFAG